MQEHSEILITGGTSGLGLELVKACLNKGYYVVAMGRDKSKLPVSGGRLEYARADFGDLSKTSGTLTDLCERHDFKFAINNAGILSPPEFTLTKDGSEYSFQVNFLAHLLINEIIIQMKKSNFPLVISTITSPVYRFTGKNLRYELSEPDYRPLKAYSDSKYFLALMCRYLSGRYSYRNVTAFSFDPGTFRSGIYRMQKPWFRNMYRIAAPFMRNPEKVAKIIIEILERKNIEPGKIYDLRKRTTTLSAPLNGLENDFWDYCAKKISPFLNHLT